MTDEEKIRNCIELIWNYEEVYDDEQFNCLDSKDKWELID